MSYITGQSFLEPIDGVRTVFTTLQPFEPHTIQVFQGNLTFAPEAILEINTVQVRTIDPASHRTWSYAAEANTLYCEAHGLVQDTQIVVWSTVDGGLPEGLVHTVLYFVSVTNENKVQLSLSQGGPFVNFEQAAAGILYFAKPSPPLLENGNLWYNATVLDEVVDPAIVVGLWVLSDWQRQFAKQTPLSTVRDVLIDADERVQAYVTENHYARAVAQEAPQYRLFRRVIGELAFFYLLRRPAGLQQITSSTKHYGDNTKNLSQTYASSASTLMGTDEATILSQLISYKRQTESGASPGRAGTGVTRTWGTGQNFGLINQDGWSRN